MHTTRFSRNAAGGLVLGVGRVSARPVAMPVLPRQLAKGPASALQRPDLSIGRKLGADEER